MSDSLSINFFWGGGGGADDQISTVLKCHYVRGSKALKHIYFNVSKGDIAECTNSY